MSSGICGYVGMEYHVAMRRYGERKFHRVGNPHRSYKAALKALGVAMADHEWKRGGVWMTADYYDPHMLVEIVRR